MVPVRRHVQHPLDLEVELMIGDPARRSQVQEVPQPEVRGPGPHRVGSNPFHGLWNSSGNSIP